jgi:hypothetical protein
VKRTFVIPEDKEPVYEKFKGLVDEVSAKLVELMEEYVAKNEKLQADMKELPIYEGTEYPVEGIFQGKTFKFIGVLIAKGTHDGYPGITMEIYLTRKQKFLVYMASVLKNGNEIKCSYKVYDTYFEMKEKAKLSDSLITECETHLSKNSTIRTYEFLDI